MQLLVHRYNLIQGVAKIKYPLNSESNNFHESNQQYYIEQSKNFLRISLKYQKISLFSENVSFFRIWYLDSESLLSMNH